MNYKVEFNNVSLRYKDFEALKNVSFQLESGKIYGLLGRNGAGKTSLLSLLSSFRLPTEGSILIGGEPPFENPKIMPHVVLVYEKDYKEERNKVSTFIQDAAKFRPFFDMDYAHRLSEKFKLPLNKEVRKLSRGMKSAMNVTIGLASRAPVTIFDEAYLGMDAPTRDLFYKELLKDQAKHPRTMILSTHLVSEMDYLFEEVLILDRGKLLLHEDYETLISKGLTVTGDAGAVDNFAKGRKILNEEQLGNTKSVLLFGNFNEDLRLEAEEQGLETGNCSLQDLFIHLTGKEDAYETNSRIS
jgi:ABC-2 type transport system ATP-binding protein